MRPEVADLLAKAASSRRAAVLLASRAQLTDLLAWADEFLAAATAFLQEQA